MVGEAISIGELVQTKKTDPQDLPTDVSNPLLFQGAVLGCYRDRWEEANWSALSHPHPRLLTLDKVSH